MQNAACSFCMQLLNTCTSALRLDLDSNDEPKDDHRLALNLLTIKIEGYLARAAGEYIGRGAAALLLLHGVCPNAPLLFGTFFGTSVKRYASFISNQISS